MPKEIAMFRIVLILIIILFQVNQAQAAYKATVDEDLDYYESGSVSDTVYGAGWNGDTATAPSKNAVYDKIETLGGGHDAVTLGTDADTLLGLSTQQLTLDSQAANLIFSGPGSGGAVDPTFRSLVDNDIPDTITASSYQLLDADLTAIAALGFTTTAFLKKTGADTWALDTATYLTAEVDGSTSNELPTAGAYIDVTGQQVDVDLTEIEAATFGAGGNASNIWTFNLSGTDPTITFSSGAVAVGGALSATGAVTGSNLSGSNTGDQTNITGNAGTVTNGVYTTNNLSVFSAT